MKYAIQCTFFYYIIANLRSERKIFGALSGKTSGNAHRIFLYGLIS